MNHHTSLGLDNRKLAMWVMIGSECTLFGSLIVNYLIALTRFQQSDQVGRIGPQEILNIPVTSASTFVLLMSSLAMVLCLDGLKKQDLVAFRRYCLLTAGLGLAFLGFQVVEFTEFTLHGLGLTTNVFGSAFFVLTGTHGAHVAVGVAWLLILYFWSKRSNFTSGHHGTLVEVAGLYWHFVDVVWIVIFTLVYLFALAP